MASPSRRSHRDLTEEIRGDGPRFRFFQAVRLLALSQRKGRGKAPIPPDLRFGTPLSLSFPASEIAGLGPRQEPRATVQASPEADGHAVQESASEALLEMTVGFMGMTGPSGSLPTAYTELLIERRNQHRDDTGHQFFDLFTHRAVSLFYQAWRKHRFYLPYEAGDHDGFSRNLLDIAGVGLRGLQQRLEAKGHGISDRFLIHYAGLLSQKPVSASNIATLVRGYFAIDAELEQFVGQWMQLPAGEQSALGSQSCHLGRNSFVGQRIWDRQSKIGLRLGPLSHEQFAEFMPDGPGRAALRELIRFCAGLTLDCDVTLILQRQAIRAPILASGAASPPRLGCNVWLNSHPPVCDTEDARFALLSNRDMSPM